MNGHWPLRCMIGLISLLEAFSISQAYQAITSQAFHSKAVLDGPGQVEFSVEFRNRSDNSPASQMAWNNLQLPAGWTTSDTYLVLHSTLTASSGGIMIYTDNTAPSATPKKIASGVFSAAGLVDNTNPDNRTLPLAWSIVDATTPALGDGAPPSGFIAADDPEFATSLHYTGQWFLMKDPGSPNLSGSQAESRGKLIPGESYATVKNAQGIHFSHFAYTGYVPTQSPDVIMLEANFTGATTPNTYSAQIYIEAYTN